MRAWRSGIPERHARTEGQVGLYPLYPCAAEVRRPCILTGHYPGRIAPGNTTSMRRRDKAGWQCHWILEIHLVDTARRFGGFYEQLLDLG